MFMFDCLGSVGKCHCLTPGCVCCVLLQLEREATLREASLASAAQDIAALQDERRGQASALQQQALELAAFERQVGS